MNKLLLLILLLGLFVRLYKIDTPLADWHSWRQVDTAAVTRNFVKEGFNPFLPKHDDMTGVAENPLPNLGRFRFVEFPIYNIVVYPIYLLFGIDETYHRLVSVLFSLGSIIFLYLITKKYSGFTIAFFASLSFAILPFNVFFSRTTLPDVTFVFWALGMIYFVDRWINEDQKKWMLWGLIFSAVAFLIKPWAVFFALPLIYSFYKKEGKLFPIPKRYLIFIILALIPFIFWRLWILNHPEGIPASNWLYNGDGIRLKPSFWWWIIQERLGGEILGASGAVLFFIGLLLKPKNGNFFLHIFALSLFLFFIIFATGNIRHNYYQIAFVPVASIFLARGFILLIQGGFEFLPRFWTILLAILFFPLTFYFGFKKVAGFYQVNNPAIVEAGKRADQILPKEALVLAPYNGDTAFLYQINRPGWPVAAFPIPELVSKYGVTHYISTTEDEKTNWVMRHFEVLIDHPNYVIADLTKLKKPFDPKDPEPP